MPGSRPLSTRRDRGRRAALPAPSAAPLAGVAALAAGLLAPPASASPRSDPTSGRQVFTGATMPHASSLTLNPAALGLGLVTEVYVALTGTVDQLGVDRRTLDLDTGALGEGASIRDVELSPGAGIAFVNHPGDRVTFGGEVASPPAEVTPEGHEALRYHTLGGRQRDYRLTVGGAVRVAERLHVGLSLALVNSSLRLRYARDTALAGGRGATGLGAACGDAPCGVENPAAAERYDVDVGPGSRFSFADLTINVGVAIRLAREAWLGVAYHTPPGLAVQSGFVGVATVTRAPRDGGGAVVGDAAVYVSLPASVDAELRARLAPDLELHVGGRWEDLSRFDAYDVRTFGRALAVAGVPEWTERARGFHDPIALWAGVEQPDVEVPEVGQRWRFGGRLGVETSALDPARIAPGAIAGTSLTLDGGAAVRLGPATMLQLGYGLAYFLPADVTASAYDPRATLACIDSGYDYATAACAAVRQGYGVPTAAGHYTRLQHAVRLGLRYEFQ